MRLNELLENLARLNITLSVEGGALHINAAKGSLSLELKEQLINHKDELIKWLQAREVNENRPSLPDIKHDGVNRYTAFPLSDLQVGFYMADDPYMEYQVRPHYYMEFNRIDFDIARYEQAWNKALRRHSGELPLVNSLGQLQLQHDIAPIECQVRDLRSLPTSQAQAVLDAVRKKLMRQELPLDRWPWFDLQVSLWRDQNGEKARIHYNHNNFFCDGYGATCLLHEVEQYYAYPELELAPRQLTFRDAVIALEKLEKSSLGRSAQDYWLERLPDLPPPPNLPQVSGRERRCRSYLQRRQGLLPAASWQSFKVNAAHYGLTPSNAVVAAYAEILAAWSDSRHFVLSHMMTRRLPMHPDINDMLGNFASLYPLEVDLRGDLNFVERALRLQNQVLLDASHLHWGGMQVMQALNQLHGEFGRSPYPFVVGSGLFMGKYKKPDFTCLETSQTLLDHQFWELDDGRYYYVWDLQEAFFPPGMIDSMWAAFDVFLKNLADDKTFWQQQQFILARGARMEIDESSAEMPIPTDLLQTGLSRMAKTLPDKDALVTFNGSLTYKVLDDWSAAIAGHLRRAKITRGDLVAVVADRSRELVAATLGILKAGAAYVPVDPGLPSERIHYMLANSQASVVLTQSRYKNSLCWPDETKLFCIESVAIEDTSPPAVEINSDDLAYVIYTSGSTGQPKGVMIDHCGAMNTILDVNKRFEVGPKDRMLGVSSFGFDLSVYDLFGTLAAGATLVYPDPQATLNPAHWLEVLQAEAITIWNSAPPLMRLLVETAQRQNTTLPRLRLVLLSGDWIPTDLPDAIKAIAPSAKVISLGGATEASIWSIYYPIEKVEPNWCSIPYGYALTNQGWCIRDSVGRDTPLWTSGELYITGVGLAKGYWRDQQKTAHSFIEDSPVCSAENASEIQMRRLYRTGDRGRYLPDGSIEFMGRVDSQVKIQGHRIELGEVEAVLQEHPLVEQAVVLAPGERHNRQLVAYVELSTRVFDSLSASEPVPQLQNFLKQKLPNYMVPAQWTVMDALPLSNNGKVDRKALTRVETATPTYESSSQAAIAPRTETEKGLAAIWEEVLQRENIGVNEDFFELGGQSFDAVRSLALIKERFGESLSLGHIWQARSIENLARHIDGNDAEASLEVLVAIETKGRGRPCFLVHPAGGQVMAYLPLAQRLPQSVYGFVAFAREDDLEAQWDIKQLASRYIEEMRRVQPQGPYTIGGWSSGGVIAFEMATQLENMRQSVDPVWMLDCPAPLQHEPISEQNMLCGFIEDLGQGLPLDLLADPSLSNLHGIKRLQCAIELYNRQRKLDLDVSQLTRIYSVFNNIVQAVRRYRPTKICADIQVIRARDGCVSEFADHPCDHVGDWGWKRLTTGSVRSAFVPGSHYSFLNEPQVNEVAVILSGNNSDAVTEIKKFA